MWPWGHLAVGYLIYSVWVYYRYRRPPDVIPVLALVFGTQFPDVVDKPLAWTLNVLPSGRSLAHSLLTATLIVGTIAGVARERDSMRVASSFGVGYFSHLLGDALLPFVVGDYGYLTFLVWPLLPLPSYETEPGFLAHLSSLELSPLLLSEFALLAAMLGVDLFVRRRLSVRQSE